MKIAEVKYFYIVRLAITCIHSTLLFTAPSEIVVLSCTVVLYLASIKSTFAFQYF